MSGISTRKKKSIRILLPVFGELTSGFLCPVGDILAAFLGSGNNTRKDTASVGIVIGYGLKPDLRY